MLPLISRLKEALSKQSSIIYDVEGLKPFYRGPEGFEQLSAREREIIAVVKPASINDVASLVTLANDCSGQTDFDFCIYPISTGLNWGYGTGQPPISGRRVVILNLSSLTAISFEQELGLVTIEPGVTQKILSDYLIKLGDEFMVPVTGAGPDCSLLGNALERGYGITPFTDHFGAVTAVEGIWGNGERYLSAVKELDNSDEKFVDKTFKWGVGPYLEGLFSQSNLGIVTQMTIRLARKPAQFTSFIIQIPNDDDFEPVVPLIRQVLREYEGIVGSINLMDRRRVLSMFADNPNPGQHKVMSAQDIDRLSKAHQVPSWTIMGSIYGSQGVARAARKEIEAIFSQVPCKQVFSDSLAIKVAKGVLSNCPQILINYFTSLERVQGQITSFELGKQIMLGKPNKMALRLAYWRHKEASSFDPLALSPGKDGCGLLWYAPLIPMKPEKMRDYVNFIRETCPQFNIEPLITFTNLKHDCVDSTVPIVFDLSSLAAVEDGHNCLQQLVSEGLKMGFVPYRLNIEQQRQLLKVESSFWNITNKIKSVLDPNQVISPGRYNPN